MFICVGAAFCILCDFADFGLWPGAECTERNDWLRGDKMVPSTRDYAQLDALQSNRLTWLLTY